jgi:hypothetical protein
MRKGVKSYFNIIALFFWSIHICLCDYLYLSTHFLWHIFSALRLHYGIQLVIYQMILNLKMIIDILFLTITKNTYYIICII